jgi:hypothetical protein
VDENSSGPGTTSQDEQRILGSDGGIANVAEESLTLTFNGVDYLHRHSEGGLHEFTPSGQDDLQRWSDMLSINVYPDADDGDALALIANAVMSAYQAHQGIILRTDSIPRTRDSPAQHLVAAMFGRPEFLEAVQARFLIFDEVGMSVIHSHRTYGQAKEDGMQAWMEEQGPATERQLMSWEGMPTSKKLQRLAQ